MHAPARPELRSAPAAWRQAYGVVQQLAVVAELAGDSAELHHFKRLAVQAGAHLAEEDGADQVAAHQPNQHQ